MHVVILRCVIFGLFCMFRVSFNQGVPMLVINEKSGGTIRVGKEIKLRILSVNGNRVRLGFEAPSHVTIEREIVARHRSLLSRSKPPK